MKRRVSTHLENWMARIPFRISRNTWDDFPCVVCEIEEGGLIGRGEALGVYYLGETEKSILEQLDSVFDDLGDGASRQDLLELLPPGGARLAADAALWDLEAQLSGTLAWETAGVSPNPVETVFTIGLEGYDSPVPLCADESCQHVGELDLAARRYQMINIKLDKCGGLTHGLELLAAARDKGLDIMVGCMGGTSLCMAPIHVLAQLADFVDIDGPLLLKNDRLGGFIYDRGMVSLPTIRFWG